MFLNFYIISWEKIRSDLIISKLGFKKYGFRLDKWVENGEKKKNKTDIIYYFSHDLFITVLPAAINLPAAIIVKPDWETMFVS